MTPTALARCLPLALACALVAPACSSSKSTSTPTAPAERADPVDVGLESRSDATPAERAERQTAYLTERLGLREEQADDVREIALASAEERARLREAGGGDRRATMQAMRRIQQDQDAKLRAVLDDGQYDEYEEVQAEVRAQMRERRG